MPASAISDTTAVLQKLFERKQMFIFSPKWEPPFGVEAHHARHLPDQCV